MKKAPPKRKRGGLQVNPKYQAMLGELRTCEVCEETKEVSPSTFGQKKTEPDGVSRVCKQCVGKAARRGEKLPQKPEKWPDFEKKPKEFWARLIEERDRLYEIGNQLETNPRKLKEFERLCHSLHAVTRMVDDPAGSGAMTDEKLAFKCFCEVMSPLIQGWTGLSEIHEDIIDALLDEDDHVLLLASRNSGKSALTQVFVAWCLYRNPLDLIIVFSSSEDIAKRGLMAVRNYIRDCPLLRFLIPKDGGIDSANKFITAQAMGRIGSNTSLAAYGIGGRTTGLRANKMILDDVESFKDTTPALQEALATNTNSVENLLNPNGKVIALGTPQIVGASIYIKWVETGDWKLHSAKLFEELPNDDGLKRPQLRSRWHSRWSDEALTKKRSRMPKHEWDLHWRIDLSTSHGDERPIKLKHFHTVAWPSARLDFPDFVRGKGAPITHIEIGEAPDGTDYLVRPLEVSENYHPYTFTLASVDPSAGTGGDEIGIAVVSVSVQGQAVIRHLTGIREESQTIAIDRLTQTINQFRPNEVIVEDNNGSAWPTMIKQRLSERGCYARVERVTSQKRKGERIISSLEVPLNTEKVVLLDDVVMAPDAVETINQIVGVRRDISRGLRHDDRVDALAWALQVLNEKGLLFIDNGTVGETKAIQKKEYLLTLSVREGGIREDGPEAILFEWDDADEQLLHRIRHLETVFESEISRGVHDKKLESLINNLKAQYENNLAQRNFTPPPPARPSNLSFRST